MATTVDRLGRPWSAPFTRTTYAGTHTCPTCGVKFQPHHPSVVYCGKSCRDRKRNQRDAARFRETGVAHPYDVRTKRKVKLAMLETATECAICRMSFAGVEPGNIHLDHDHQTGQVRDLLCFKCNTGLGHFRDNIETMEAAIAYLKRWSDK